MRAITFGPFIAALSLAACGQERDISRGAALYVQNCAICHGADLRGGGGVGVRGLNRIPTDLTVLAVRNGGNFPRAEVIGILQGYGSGTQSGRIMRPFAHLNKDKRRRVRTEDGRVSLPAPQAALLAYLEAAQLP
ncbi:MAG: c-type cytochrome [Roseobacter sp.]